MFDKFKQTIHQAGETLKEQASALGEAAKEKGYQIIEQWISILPVLEKQGLKVTFFSVGVSISPELEVELQGKTEDFTLERIQQILDEYRGNTPLTLVFTTVKSTYHLNRQAKIAVMNPLTICIKVRLSPEIRVSFGKPLLF
jgi:hypothetical protein